MPARLSIVGEHYGRLTVLEMIYSDGRDARVRCRCDCGAAVESLAYNVRNGNTASCGCLAAERRVEVGRRLGSIQGKRNATHGMSKTPTYVAWLEARKRCFKPQNERYAYYGGRGITMCERWSSFENFLADMGVRPDGLSLDRWPDNDGHYEPGNCRWATAQEQSSNRRNCNYVALDGERVTTAEAARRLGVAHGTVKNRLAKGQLQRWPA